MLVFDVNLSLEFIMVLCPVAIAIGCRKCPIFRVCPVKGIIGDYKRGDDAPAKTASGKANGRTKKRQ
jgi:hypothetical protein